MAKEIETKFLHSQGEMKDSKKVEHFHFHIAKKWHDRWIKIVMHMFGISIWILVLGGIFGAGYLIRWIFKLFIL